MSTFGIEGGAGGPLRGSYASWLRPQGPAETLRPAASPDKIGENEGPGFGGALADAIARVDGLQQDVAQKTEAIAKGEPVALHDVMTSMGKSEVAFNLLLEVRNKLVDAWEKLSRSVV
jgi:flagellar hook-basal body complex protein FliE